MDSAQATVADGITDVAKSMFTNITNEPEKLPPLTKTPENRKDIAEEEEHRENEIASTEETSEHDVDKSNNSPQEVSQSLETNVLEIATHQIAEAISTEQSNDTDDRAIENNSSPEETKEDVTPEQKTKEIIAPENDSKPEPTSEEEEKKDEYPKEEDNDEKQNEEVPEREENEPASEDPQQETTPQEEKEATPEEEAATPEEETQTTPEEEAAAPQEEKEATQEEEAATPVVSEETTPPTCDSAEKKEIASDVANALDAIIKKVSEEEEKNEDVVDDTTEDLLITAVDDAASKPDPEPEPEPEQEQEDEPEPDVPPIPVAKYSDEELQEALKKMLKKKQLPDVEMRPSVIDFAKKQSIFQLMNEEYDQAAKIDEAVEIMVASLHTDESSYDCEQQTLTLKQKLEDAQAQNKQIRDEFAERIAQFKEMENERLEKLQEQHEMDRQAFEADWSRPEALIQFNKPSSALLQLRRQQKSFAISHHFDQAKQLKLAGDQMQREEAAQASRRAAEAMRNAYAKLLEKQDKEIQCFMENGYRKLQAMESERDRRLQANENLRNQLDHRIRGPKQPRRPTVTVPQVQSRGEPRASVTGVITFRTRSQFAGYKKATEKTRLDVKIGDVQKITKPMTPSPRKGQRKPIRFV